MIDILEREFTPVVGGSSQTAYNSNAGDATICRYLIRESITFINSNGVSFTIDQTNNKIYISGGSWTLGGLITGDNVVLIHNGNAHPQTVVSVSSSVLELDDIHSSIQQNDLLEVRGQDTFRQSANIYVNHAFQSAGFTLNSHIDLEKTGLKVDGATALGSYPLTQFGNQSGQFRITDATIELKSIYNDCGGVWEIIFTIINSGIYAPQIANPLEVFNLVFGVQFFRINANPNTAELKIDNYLSNIGWYGMGYGDEPATGFVLTPIPNMKYNVAGQTFTVQIGGVPSTASTLLGFGASYIPTDNSYFKNKPINQSELGMTVETTDAGVGTITGSNTFQPGTPEWSIEILGDSYNATTNILTVDLAWYPAFNGFMNDRDGDRLFYVWLKVGNTNHLIFSGQLTKEPTPNEEITPDFFQVATFEEQITTPISNDNEQAVIEDNLAMLVRIPLVQNSVYQAVKALVYLEKTATSEKVVLSSQNWNLTTNPYPNGFYVGSFAVNANTNLSSGSVKNQAVLSFTNPVGANYKAIINYPFLINWRNWIPLGGMFPEFYPNQNNNWLNYIAAGFKFWMEVQLLNADGSYSFTREELTFEGYDGDGKVTHDFVLKKSDGTGVSHIIDEQMIIEITHEGTTATPTLSALKLEFTIEPKQGQPRWQVSTEYSETNPNNPLSIVSTSITAGVSTSIIAIDTTKIDISGGVSITSEIKGLCGADPILSRHKETYEYLKLPTFGGNDQTRCGEGCCEMQIKVASLTDSAPEKNDVTAVYYKSDGEGGELQFTVWKDGAQVEAVSINNTGFEPLGRFGQVIWREILADHGTGCYEIRYQGVIGSVPFDGIWGRYQLLEYSCELVREHVRIRTYFDKYFKKENINFRGSNLYDDIRILGTFGEMQPIKRSEVLMYGDDFQRMANQENIPSYKLFSKLVTPIIARLLIRNILVATDIFVSEYHPDSPDFLNYENVVLPQDSTMDIEYLNGTRKRGFSVTFHKKERNERVYLK